MTEPELAQLAEEIIKEFASSPLEVEGEPAHATASAAVVEYQAGADINSVMASSRESLNSARKKKGGSCVVSQGLEQASI
jgi:GGDEF domain-containing protein